ncbi:MAG TPA: signal peptidase I [Xanthomonadales bacterium]|nr:signal peptidase I [Xanthomonadales bacterium]
MEIAKKVYNFILDTMQTILLAASIFLVVYIFLFRPFQVSGESMFPTYENKEYILTSLIHLRFQELKKGDVIVFKSPTDPDKDYIKRVMATEGDSIYLKEGFVYVNDQQVDESTYIDSEMRTYGGSFLKEGTAVTVPKDDYIVMGDNRPFSSDSREWGFLSKTKVIGKSLFVYWPVNSMRWIKNPFN